MGNKQHVKKLEVPVHEYERTVRTIERKTKFQAILYNADIVPEQQFLYQHNLRPCTQINIETKKEITDQIDIPLIIAQISGQSINGVEYDIHDFVTTFKKLDPDIIFMQRGFSELPKLVKKIEQQNLSCPFHRWDPQPITYRGGRTFHTYGSTRYQDFGIRLHGRILIDTSTTIGLDCHTDALIEMAQLSGMCLQQVASRSYGAVFQAALVRTMYRDNVLVPHKHKPIDKPLTLYQLIKSDRVGHTFDAKTGFHTNVAQFDFSSMYPWLMYNHNISAETILSNQEPLEKVPSTPITITRAKQGYVPQAIKPFIDKRMYYKAYPNTINKQRAAGLKWILVSSYGYLRYREFKLGIPTSHMAIGAYARNIMLQASNIAHQEGYKIIHGIIDALYIQKEDMNHEQLMHFKEEVTRISGVPLFFEGIFKWVVFLPSVQDLDQPVPARYYGAYADGSIKARGLAVRQRVAPVIQKYQQQVLDMMGQCDTQQQICSLFLWACRQITQFKNSDENDFIFPVKVGKEKYKGNTIQSQVQKLVDVQPGQNVKIVMTKQGAQLPGAQPDWPYYERLLKRALFVLYQPFGYTQEQIDQCVSGQMIL